jgi:hypothetical protein
MKTLLQLFIENPLGAAVTIVILLLLTGMPVAGGKLPDFFLLLIRPVLRTLALPFRMWRRNLISLVQSARGHARDDRAGRSIIVHGIIIGSRGLFLAGGIAILTTGVLYGISASGVQPDDAGGGPGQRSDPAGLQHELAVVRSRLGALDLEWRGIESGFRTRHEGRVASAGTGLVRENALLEEFLSRDEHTGALFAEVVKLPPAGASERDFVLTWDSRVPLLPLNEWRQAFLIRYLENCRALEEVAGNITAPLIPPDRDALQPRYASERAREAELVAAIASDEVSPNIPGPGRGFDPGAFAATFLQALIIFWAFSWICGSLVDSIITIPNPRGNNAGWRRKQQSKVDDPHPILWVE